MERPHASSPEKVPSTDAVPAVSAAVESQLRRLMHIEASRQQWEREERKRKTVETGKADDGTKEKIGWAEAFQQSARGRINKVMHERKIQETETLSDPIVAQMLRDIVETGKIGKNDVPPEFRKVVADFCARTGTPEHWWPATLRAAWCLELGRSLGIAAKPGGTDLLPETRAFLGGLDYEYGQKKAKEREIGVEGKAQRGPKQIAARLESRTPAIRESAMGEFDTHLDGWIMKPPKNEDARREHFTDVELVLVAAEGAMDKVSTLTAEKKNSLACRMETAKASIASKRSGEARIRRT